VQRELLKSLVEPKTPANRRGRPWRETRAVLEGVLWIRATFAKLQRYWKQQPGWPPALCFVEVCCSLMATTGEAGGSRCNGLAVKDNSVEG
jgi:hypothetical protein